MREREREREKERKRGREREKRRERRGGGWRGGMVLFLTNIFPAFLSLDNISHNLFYLISHPHHKYNKI